MRVTWNGLTYNMVWSERLDAMTLRWHGWPEYVAVDGQWVKFRWIE